MSELPDYEGIIASLQADNEGLRERLTRAYLSTQPLNGLTWYQVRSFISKPHFIVGCIVGVLFAILYGLVPDKE